jgi:hypothetical protein
MQLDKLVLDLHPRTNMQALDLGFSLLRIASQQTYLAWIALWLPLMGLLTLLACLIPEHSPWLYFVAWFLRPLLERAPLYVLSRAVFGEHVRWQDAVRAWPRQLAGGWLRLLLLRPLMAGRCLRQPIWLLEGARGKAANDRFDIISRQSAGSAAVWFGIACAHFEAILEFGIIALISIFISQAELVNPFSLIMSVSNDSYSLTSILISYGLFALGGIVIAPIYVACGFTLYLNRRAVLEAWDIELVLRQIHPPKRKESSAQSSTTPHTNKVAAWLPPLLLPLLLPLFLYATLIPEAAAAPPKTNIDAGTCNPPPFWQDPEKTQKADKSTAQTAIRNEVREIFEDDDLLTYRCEYSWFLKKSVTQSQSPELKAPLWLNVLALILKVLLISITICLVLWFLYRFRHAFVRFLPKPQSKLATEVGGLDISPESLPADIVQTVRQLWQSGQQRAALALLYRATLSRLVSEDALYLSHGATEGDCLRQAQQAHEAQRLNPQRWQITQETTDLWQLAAYAQRWPGTEQVFAACQAWQQAFVDTVKHPEKDSSKQDSSKQDSSKDSQ